MNKGKLIIFSAPSGSGKSTLVNYLLHRDLSLEFSISACNRSPRKHEQHGKQYYFLSPEDFQAKINQNEFLEWEEVYQGRYYGTLKSEVERIWGEGKHVIFDIDVEGGLNLKKQFGDLAFAVFVKAPSIEVIKKRLIARKTENDSNLKMRLNKVKSEMTFAKYFDTIVVNDDLEEAQLESYEKVSKFIYGNR